MIRLTRLSHVPIVLNADLIQSIESTPDTVITLTSGQKVMVRETADDVVERVVDYRRRLHSLAVLETGSVPPDPKEEQR